MIKLSENDLTFPIYSYFNLTVTCIGVHRAESADLCQTCEDFCTFLESEMFPSGNVHWEAKNWRNGRLEGFQWKIENCEVGRCRLHIRCLISFLSLFVLLYLSFFVFLYLCIIAFEQPVGRRPQSRRLSSFSIWTGTLWRPTVRCRVPPAQVISTAASGLVKGLEWWSNTSIQFHPLRK